MSKHSSVLFKASDYLAPRFWSMWLIIGSLRLASLFPFSWQLRFGSWMGRMTLLLSNRHTASVDTNLAKCFPEKTASERDQIKRACYQNIGISLFEMAMCWWWPADKLRSLVEIRGQEHVEQALASGRGAILLTGHFTSLEIGARLLALFMPIQVMYRTQRNALFDSYLYTRRSSYFENTVSRKNMRQLIKGIKEGIPTWYAPDQNFRRERNVFAPFMGILTATITASSRLAQSSGAVMIPYYPERKADGSGYILHIEPPLPDFPSGDDLEDATAINASIENFVRRFPESYMWIHQRFRSRPPGEARFYS